VTTRPEARSRLAFALDYGTLAEARHGAELTAESVGVMKVGLELFVREGPPAVRMCQELGCDVFLDLKLMDISETVQRAVASAGELGVKYLTLHASGGRKMLESARAVVEHERLALELLAVTVLTSLDARDLHEVGVEDDPSAQVVRLAKLAGQAGIRGLVCSALEVPRLRSELGREAVLVTPGIRPAGAASGDQKRIATPADAIRDGADLLVVGRPIRDSADPRAAARAVAAEIEAAL
jgi:orotidine-5'-phosphate decarboxylase